MIATGIEPAETRSDFVRRAKIPATTTVAITRPRIPTLIGTHPELARSRPDTLSPRPTIWRARKRSRLQPCVVLDKATDRRCCRPDPRPCQVRVAKPKSVNGHGHEQTAGRRPVTRAKAPGVLYPVPAADGRRTCDRPKTILRRAAAMIELRLTSSSQRPPSKRYAHAETRWCARRPSGAS